MNRFLASLDRLGAFGALIAAALAPCCFPLFAALGAIIGLETLGHYESLVLSTFKVFALLSWIGLGFAFAQHRRPGPFLVGSASVAILGYAFYGTMTSATLYLGLGGLLAATLWNYFSSRRLNRPVLRSTLTCPHCSHRAHEIMPTDACVYFFECPRCHALVKPARGDCCVFCSYGSVPCPPIQTGSRCGA